MKTLGMYIHVPFCNSLCPYCDFYKLRYNEGQKEKYVERLVLDIISKSESLASKEIDTIYFGGGTPSVLAPADFEKILGAIYDNYNVSKDAEITVECNPSSKLEELIPTLARLGVNRISLGLQSARDSERKGLGRLSGKERVTECLALIRNSGITNITLDLMIALPDQTEETLLESLEYIKDSGVPHVSAYILKIEEGTNFYKNIEKLNLPSEEDTADLYIKMCEFFEDAGLMQYEISNFAKPGFQSQHNLKYWHTEEYIGFGPAAHSYVDGKRFYMPADFERFILGAEPISDGEGGSDFEKIMLALRLTEGYKGEISDEIKTRLDNPILKELVICDENGLRLTRAGLLLSNTVIGMILGTRD